MWTILPQAAWSDSHIPPAPPEGLLATETGRKERQDPGETPIDGGLSSGAAVALLLQAEAGKGSITSEKLQLCRPGKEPDPAEGQASAESWMAAQARLQG